MKAEDFIGLTKKNAQDKAEGRNFIFRLIRIDNKAFFDYPPANDFCAERLCVELENGKVVVAKFM